MPSDFLSLYTLWKKNNPDYQPKAILNFGNVCELLNAVWDRHGYRKLPSAIPKHPGLCTKTGDNLPRSANGTSNYLNKKFQHFFQFVVLVRQVPHKTLLLDTGFLLEMDAPVYWTDVNYHHPNYGGTLPRELQLELEKAICYLERKRREGSN